MRLVEGAVNAVENKTTLSAMVLALVPALRTLGLAILRAAVETRDPRLAEQAPALRCTAPQCRGWLKRSRRRRLV